MTTSPIYEPIARISDDYFWPPKKDSVAGRREPVDDRNVFETRKLALNITDGNVTGWTAGGLSPGAEGE